MLRKILIRLSGTGLLIVALFTPLAQQRDAVITEQEGSVYTLQVYEDLILVDVVVMDKKGNPVRNLKKEDFLLFEDNKPQSVSTFDFEDLTSMEKAGELKPIQLPKIDLAQKPITSQARQELRDHRFLILFLDQSSMPIEDLIQAQKTVKEFIEAQLTPADLVAVVSNGTTLQLLQNFTNDREALKKAVSKLYAGDSASLADAEVAAMSTDDSSAADSYTSDDSQFNIFNTDRKLYAIEAVGKMFRDIPGKKFLIHFSSGITTTGAENQSQLHATIDRLNQANTSLYAVDVRGLTALPPGGGANQAGAGGTANFSGQAVRSQTDSLYSSQETLATLSLDTGGKPLFDNNNLGKVFETVREDSNSYYLLGYYSSNAKRDGRYRRIKLQVRNPDFRLKFREGYFASKSFGQYTSSDRERHLEEAINSERPFSEIPFLISANFIRASQTEVFVPVSIKFPASAIPFDQKGEKAKGGFDFIGQARGDKGKVESVVRDTIQVKLDQETTRKTMAGDIQYNTAFFLKPGNYSLKFLVRENQTGKLGTFEQPLSVPDYSREPLSLSSLILSDRLLPVSSDKSVQRRSFWNLPPFMNDVDPLIIGQNRIIPNATRVFSSKDTLYIFFQIYLKTVSKAPDLQASLAFQREGKLFRNAGSVNLNSFDEGTKDTITNYFQVPLAGFPVGAQALQVGVEDKQTSKVYKFSINFVVH
jgi:VWFA-related protein